MKAILLLAIIILPLFCWVGNIVKLARCDFEAPYKGEVIHAIGLIGPASIVTFWFNDK
jgi:predicted secreted protein